MSLDFRIRRRAFIRGVLALGAAAAWPAGARQGGPRAPVPGDLPPLQCLASARRIGRAYLRGHPGEADAGVLRARLTPNAGMAEAGPDDWRKAIRADFAAGRTVVIEGWVLSRTEARLCALALFA